jgi:hypothetical protein
VDVAVDPDGSVWCAHYFKNNIQISHLRLDGKWEIFNESNEWGLLGDGGPRYIRIDPEGNKWLGSWGGWFGGPNIIKIEEDTFKIITFPLSNFAISGMGIDPQNNKWFAGIEPFQDQGHLRRLSPDDSTWTSFSNLFGLLGIVQDIAIDSSGFKWLGSFNNGLRRFNDEDGSLVSFNNGLPSVSVLSVKVDRWNRVWVATRAGAAVIENGIVTPFQSDDVGSFLGIVSDVAFDVEGGVWLQTEDNGISRRGPDGRWDVYRESDGLVSEDIASGEIRAIDVNMKTGEVWIGTAHGLSLFQSPFIPTFSTDEVEVFPNPFTPSKGHSFITFKNVPPDATIHIFTLSGELVHVLEGNDSSLVEWSGLNEMGEATASGLYLFTVTDPGGGRKVGKFALVR